MIFETITLSLLLGKLRGGKIRNLESLYINGWYLFVGSFLIEIVTLLIISNNFRNLGNIIEENFFYINLFIYLFLIIGLWMNFHDKGLRITLFGSILNFVTLIMNNGRMPVSVKALKYSNLYNQISLLQEGRIITHSLANKDTKLIFLGDIIPIPKPYLFPKIISIGDILIALGLFILIQSYMKKNIYKREITSFFKP